MRPGRIISLLIIVIPGLLVAVIGQLFTDEPVSRSVHIRNFRYGKDPSVIRCNRGDTLHLTFSSDDTGHSFFLEEFNVDAKVTPLRDDIEIFNPNDPAGKPVISKELVIIARHTGMLNYLVSKSNYRCHVWCGPMHAFESGKLIILPNTLLLFSIGCMIGIIFLWVLRFVKEEAVITGERKTDLFRRYPLFEKLAGSRWPQMILTVLALLLIYVVIMTTIFGTKVSGRNLGVLLMWAVWLFLLVSVLTPLGGRIWCSICPLPMLGDFIQRRSFFSPLQGKTNGYNNHFSGLSLRWPLWLQNSWLRLFFFLVLATFSTTLVAVPRVSGISVLALILIPTLMAMIWELRAFCRYVCPISVFITPFSELSPIQLRSRSGDTCTACRSKFCSNGNALGWACPYGLNTGELERNTDCGLCLECVRSCTYHNVAVFAGQPGKTVIPRNMSESWLAVAVFTTSVIYSFLYLGHWPLLRDYVNILDKDNWDLFAKYSAAFWSLTLVFVPGLLYLLAASGKRLSGSEETIPSIFRSYAGLLLPLGLMIWVSFVIPMLFVNVTFIAQSLSDPFGWGWDFFGTANIPWKQFLPQYIPWFQAILVLTGLNLSLKNILRLRNETLTTKQNLFLFFPVTIFLVVAAFGMIVFFTN